MSEQQPEPPVLPEQTSDDTDHDSDADDRDRWLEEQRPPHYE